MALERASPFVPLLSGREPRGLATRWTSRFPCARAAATTSARARTTTAFPATHSGFFGLSETYRSLNFFSTPCAFPSASATRLTAFASDLFAAVFFAAAGGAPFALPEKSARSAASSSPCGGAPALRQPVLDVDVAGQLVVRAPARRGA